MRKSGQGKCGKLEQEEEGYLREINSLVFFLPKPAEEMGTKKRKGEGEGGSEGERILWPPLVIVENTRVSKAPDGRWTGLGNPEMACFLAGWIESPSNLSAMHFNVMRLGVCMYAISYMNLCIYMFPSECIHTYVCLCVSVCAACCILCMCIIWKRYILILIIGYWMVPIGFLFIAAFFHDIFHPNARNCT
jgi:hypothetical protein